MANRLRLQLLGKPMLFLDNIAVTGFASAKVLALMAYLATTARPHTREALATLLWSESENDAEAKTSLRQALANIRKLGLEPFLIIERESVTINISEIETDIEQFLQFTALPIKTEASLSEIYRGDFLEGFNLKDTPEFDEWVLLQREYFRENAMTWLNRAIELCLSERNYGRGVILAKYVLALDAWREEAHRLLMLFFAKQGQRSAALAQFEKCKNILQKALYVAPSRETIALYERIRLANSLSRFNLPATSDAFVGRNNDIKTIIAQILKPSTRWLSIVGMGGMGKSRLAIEVAQQLTEDFLNGVFFAGLSTANGLDGVLNVLAETLGVSLNSIKNPRQMLINYLRDKELLIILDNYETLLNQTHTAFVTQFFNEIVNTCPWVKILVTSRERIGLRIEYVHLLNGMSYPANPCEINDLSMLLTFTAAQLYVQKIAQFNLTLETVNEFQCVAKICKLVNGMPLGIELAASWAGVLPCAEIASEIENSIDFVASKMSDVPESQHSIRAVFDSSWARLSQPEQDVFLRLSMFRGGFNRHAAENIAHANLAILSSLHDKCFINRQENDRYDTHALMRQFAIEIFDKRPIDQEATQLRFSHYFIDFCVNKKNQLRSAEQLNVLNNIKKEIFNIRLAWSILISNEDLVRLNQAIQPIADYYFISGLYHELIDVFTDSISRFNKLQSVINASQKSVLEMIYLKIYGHLVYFYFWVSNYGEMRKCIALALKYCNEADQDSCAFAYTRIGIAYVRGMGDPITAKNYLERGLTLALATKDDYEIGWAYWGHSLWYYDQGDYENAVEYAKKCMFIRSKSGDMVNYAKALNQLGNAENYLGHYEHAIQIFTEMITIMTAVSNEREVDQAHYNLGLTHYFLGMYDEAYDDFQSMFNYGLRVGDVNNMTLAINGLAMARNEQGNYAEAMEWCLRALDECNKFDEWYAKVYLSQTLGQAYLHMNMFEKAKCAFAEGLELGLARGLVPGILHNMLGWACYYIQIGRDLDYARLLLQQVVAHRGSIHFSRTRAQALLATMPAQPTARPTSPNATIAELADLAREVGVL